MNNEHKGELYYCRGPNVFVVKFSRKSEHEKKVLFSLGLWDLCWGSESVMRVVLMTGNISSVVSIVVPRTPQTHEL